MNNYQNVSEMTEKYLSTESAILFWNRSRDCSVYTTLEVGVAGVRRYRCSSTTWLLFCLFGVKGVKGTAKSSLPRMIYGTENFVESYVDES